jgi:Protein of unknown function (DUF2971)
MEHGLDNVRNERIKVSELDKLNDPFEFMAVEVRNRALRTAFSDTKKQLASRRGILCFSNSWNNPVQWGHYADCHRGVALGFDIPDEFAVAVEYVKNRILIGKDGSGNKVIDEELMFKWLSTKYQHWACENEIRVFVRLDNEGLEARASGNLIFQPFSEQLILKEVVIGASAHDGIPELLKAIPQKSPLVKLTKARLAFQTFKVVKHQNYHFVP